MFSPKLELLERKSMMLSSPTGIAVRGDYIYITNAKSILQYTLDGEYVGYYGDTGTGSDSYRLSNPDGVFVDKSGKPVKVPEVIFKDFKPYFCDTIKIK